MVMGTVGGDGDGELLNEHVDVASGDLTGADEEDEDGDGDS
jgi:hypothetical protein